MEVCALCHTLLVMLTHVAIIAAEITLDWTLDGGEGVDRSKSIPSFRIDIVPYHKYGPICFLTVTILDKIKVFLVIDPSSRVSVLHIYRTE